MVPICDSARAVRGWVVLEGGETLRKRVRVREGER
jgi:hypothetical protein